MESRDSQSVRSMSKIEKKMMKGTFQSNPNNLSHKDQTSVFSLSQKTQNSMSMTYFSVSQSLQGFLHEPTYEVDLSGISAIREIESLE